MGRTSDVSQCTPESIGHQRGLPMVGRLLSFVVTVDGDFFKGGLGGQGLYISPSRDLTIAWFGTPTEEGEGNRMLPIARQLALSALFSN